MSLAFVAPNINRGGGKRDLAARLSSGVALLALFPFGELRFKCHAHGSAWFCVHILSESKSLTSTGSLSSKGA